jgi:hypothetical protein
MRPHKAPSQGIGRELEALGHGPRVSSGDPKRSEGSGRELGTHKAPSQGIGRELEASGVLPLCTARTRSAVRVPCPDLKHRATGCNVWPGPERSEGAPSQKIGRELEASHMLPND